MATEQRKLTAKDVVAATEFMRPIAGEVIILAFVNVNGKYAMAAPIAASWLEMISYATHCMGTLPGMKPHD